MRLTLRSNLDVLAWILIVGIFAIDLRYPAEFAANLLYVGVILLALWSAQSRLAIQVAAVGTFLSIIDDLLSPPARDPTVAYFNRGVGVLVLWVTALGVRSYRRTVNQREAARQRMQEYLDIVSVAVLVVNPEGRVVLMNRRGLELIGLTEADLLGKAWIDVFVPAEDRRQWRDTMAAVHRGDRLAGSSQVSRMIARDGTLRVMSWSNAILRDEAGTLTGMVSSGEEITDRLRAEDALRRSVKDLEDLKYALDQSAIVATTDVRGDITYVNDKFCEISKYSHDELIGRNHRILNSGQHPTEFFRELYRTIGQGRVWRGEIRNRAKDGSLYWVDTTVVPFVDERGHPYQYVAIRYDITERKESEAALREQAALAQLGKMAAVVAHEVRNPLAGIRGALQVIGRRLADGSRERDIASEIITRIDTLNDIVNDLLQFARPRQPVLSSFSAAQLVQETATLLREDPSVANIDIRVEQGNVMVPADREQLKLVLLNLLFNSAHAMQGKGTIRVSTAERDGFIELRVVDEGPGIPPHVREHLFEPFFTTKHRGTGLGLATARRILDAHHGTIELDSPPAGGAAAIIRLPTQPQKVEK